jgi:hypothetical protein
MRYVVSGLSIPAAVRLQPIRQLTLTLPLDRFFVHGRAHGHRQPGDPLDEVEFLVDSLMNKRRVLRGNNVIKPVREQAVVKLDTGARIRLSAAQFERLSKAFLGEIPPKLA